MRLAKGWYWPFWLEFAPKRVTSRPVSSHNSICQRVPNQQDKIAAKLICLLARRILDSMITSVVAERSILELAVSVLYHFDLNFPPEKVEQDLCFRL